VHVGSYAGEDWAEEILLDPSTYAYRGQRVMIVKDRRFGNGGMLEKGTTESFSTLLAAAVVDRPGQRSPKRP
jgi:hypothetical protein